MTQFGFEFEDVVEDDADYDEDSSETRENERVRTISAYNLELFNPKKTEGKWGIPKLLKEKHVPKSLMGFNYVKSAKNYDSGVHFFVDDYQFERVWNDPSKYVQLLAPFDCVLTPDFSLYRDMPLCMQMWNTYRSRLIGQYWQESGLTVIPTVSWCEKESYDFCFDGLPENSVLAISSVGILADSKAMPLFKDGIKELIERKHPTKLIVYGRPIKDFDYGVETVSFSNSVTDRLDGYKRKKRNE